MPIISLDKVDAVYRKIKKLNLSEKWELLRDLTSHIQSEEALLRNKIREENYGK